MRLAQDRGEIKKENPSSGSEPGGYRSDRSKRGREEKRIIEKENPEMERRATRFASEPQESQVEIEKEDKGKDVRSHALPRNHADADVDNKEKDSEKEKEERIRRTFQNREKKKPSKKKKKEKRAKK